MSRQQQINSMNMNVLYRRHRSMCLRAAYGVAGDRNVAEDAVHDVFMRLRPDHIDSLPGEKLPAYLRRAAVNAARDVLRTDKRLRECSLTDASGRGIRDHRADPEELADAVERSKLVRKMIERLPPRCQEVVRFTIYEGLTHHEVGDRLHVSVKAVERHITRALVHMRKMPEARRLLDGQGGVPDSGRGVHDGSER